MIKEFKEFAFKGNVIDLAVGVVIGAAFGKIVSGIVDDLVMPLVGLVLPGGDWRNDTIALGTAQLKIGHLIGVIIDFLLVAFVLFLVITKLVRKKKSTDGAVQLVATTRECPACTEQIPLKARRCKFCTEVVSVLGAA